MGEEMALSVLAAKILQKVQLIFSVLKEADDTRTENILNLVFFSLTWHSAGVSVYLL